MSDEIIAAGLKVLEDKAAYYRLCHGIITGKFDQDFTDWKTEQRSKVDETVVGTLPDVEPIVEFIFTEATTNDLFLLQDKLNAIMAQLLTELFGRYAEKDVRGALPDGFGLVELGEMRKDLVNTLNSTLQMGRTGMLPEVFGDPATLEALKSVGKRRKFGDGFQWDLPDAPSPEKTGNGPVTVTPGTNNYRAHNTTVKLVVDGVLCDAGNLGAQCKLLFPNLSVQDVGRLFEGWHSDWCGDGTKPPQKVLKRDNREVYFTIVG